jgi:hypothetical protein
VDFQNGSRLSESDLDTAYQQGLFVAQEVSEDASTNQYVALNEATQTAISVATAATQAIADAAVADAESASESAIQAALQAGTRLTNFASHEVVSDATNGLIDGTNTVFNITSFPPRTETPEAYRVTIDGIMQSPTDAYTIGMNPDIITFSSAPPVGAKIVVVTAASAATAVSVDNTTIGLTSTNRAEVKDGGITNDKLADVIDDDTMATASDTTLATSESIKAYVDDVGTRVTALESTASVSAYKSAFTQCPAHSSSHSFSHGLSGVPDIVSVQLRAKTAGQGFAEAEIVLLPNNTTPGSSFGHGIEVNSSEVVFIVGANGLVVIAPDGSQSTIIETNFEIKVIAATLS